MKLITRDQLKSLLATRGDALLLDVLLAETFEESHLPGAKNACVYEVVFLENVAKLTSDKSLPIVVYGSSANNHASATAAEKLARAGYTHVSDYRGGLDDWQSAGEPVEGNGRNIAAAEPRDGIYPIDPDKSLVEWTGRNAMSSHTGTLRLKKGCIEIQNGSATSGNFTIDMNSMTNRDLEDGSLRKMLLDHLMSDDFFETNRYPTAEFVMKTIERVDTFPGSANAKVSGALTLKGVTQPLAFDAVIATGDEGSLTAEAHFDIDRTRWNVLYGSGRFYEKLGKHLVHDAVTLGVKLLARRA